MKEVRVLRDAIGKRLEGGKVLITLPFPFKPRDWFHVHCRDQYCACIFDLS
jgi:hypothetical protein